MTTKRIILLILVSCSFVPLGFSQKFKSKESTTSFFSSTPIEDIEALTKETKSAIDADEKTFLFKVPITSFVFKSELMRDHFNENYLESKKFPYATFSGRMEGPVDFKTDGQYSVNAVGEFTIHGVTRKVSIPSIITIMKGVPTIESVFLIKLADYGIAVPKIVFNKIAEEIEVKIKSIYSSVKID